MERLKEIAATSGDSLFLADGPPQPDWRLLDLCADALHAVKQGKKLMERRLAEAPPLGRNWTPAEYARADGLFREAQAWDAKAVQILRGAQKIKATTAAGIYAKALLVRHSKTGASGLAASLAADLIDCPGLRESLWPAPAHTAA